MYASRLAIVPDLHAAFAAIVPDLRAKYASGHRTRYARRVRGHRTRFARQKMIIYVYRLAKRARSLHFAGQCANQLARGALQHSSRAAWKRCQCS